MIRPSEPKDTAAVRAVHLAAFPTAAEAELVERLEAERDVVVSLVAERDNEVIGHVLLSRMSVSGDGKRYRALGLGPVAVLPPFQHSGIGSALIRAALAVAEALGEEMVFVLGEPAYYRRFGFDAETAAPFASPYAGPFFMALCLGDVTLPDLGRADYAGAFSQL